MLGPPTQTYRLRWNNESSAELNLSESFKELRDSSEFFDVSLGCSLKGGGARILRAHQMILISYSTVFRDMLREHPNKKDPLIYLKGISFLELGSILDFMYNGEVNISQPNLSSFLNVAEELQIKGLQLNQKDKENIKRPRMLDDREEIKRPRMLDNMEDIKRPARMMEDREEIKRPRMLDDIPMNSQKIKRPQTFDDLEKIKRPQTFDDLDSFMNKTKYETVDKYMDQDEFDATKYLKQEKMPNANNFKKEGSYSGDDPISTASNGAAEAIRQANQILIKDETVGDPVARSALESVDEFIETTDKTFIDDKKKRRIISKCKICQKEIRRDGIKKHIRGVHKEYINKMKEEGGTFPTFENSFGSEFGNDTETPEEPKAQEPKAQEVDSVRCKICQTEIRRDRIKKHITSVHKDYINKMKGKAPPAPQQFPTFENSKEEASDFPTFENSYDTFDMETSEESKTQEENSLGFFD